MKAIKLIVLSFALVSVLFHSKPSHAAISAVAGAPALVTGGLVVAGGAVALESVAVFLEVTGGYYYKDLSVYALIVTVPIFLLGILILDEDKLEASYAKLDAGKAKNLGITTAELSAYNAEIDEINALANFVDANMTKKGEAGIAESRDLWADVKDSISPEAFSALVKVTSPAFKK